ncbi:MAG TPA: PhnD/SsuA/transferrin family substrate-binding protein [Polyangiaceae bacterium]|jgi:hypothetical protein
MKPTTLLVPASVIAAVDVPRVVATVEHQTGLTLTVAPLSSASLLPQILERSPEVVAWAPSYVAFVLERMHLAMPLLTVGYAGAGLRSAVLVGRRGVSGLVDLRGRRIGWVSRFSITGYDLPRLYLESFGIAPDTLFGAQRFCGSHAASADALVRGDVDVVATHSRAMRSIFDRTAARVLATIGPVPSDVMVAGTCVPAAVREHLVRQLRATRVGAVELGHAREGHLDLFGMLRRHAWDLGGRPSSADAAASLLQSAAWTSPAQVSPR